MKYPDSALKKIQEKFVKNVHKKDLIFFSEEFLAGLKEVVPYTKCAIKLILNPQRELVKIGSFGLSLDFDVWSSNAGEQRLNEKVLITGDYVEIPKLYVHPLTRHFKDIYQREGIRASLAIPIKSPWETIGVLNLYKGRPGPFPKNLITSLKDLLSSFGTTAHLLCMYQEEKQGKEILQREYKELKNLRNFHELILENIPVGVTVTNEKGYVVLMNQALERMSKQKKERILGRKWYEAFGFYGETRERLEKTYWTGKTNYFPEIHLTNVDGGTIPVEMKTTLIKGEDGDVVGVAVICSDLTEKKKLEMEVERVERLSALGQVATGIAHEIRNPLAGISGILQMLKGRLWDDEEAHYLLEKTFEEINRLNNILENLLSLGSSQSLSFEKASIEELCKDVLLFAETLLATNNVTLLKRFGAEIPTVYIDKGSIKQVILNVLLNSIRAMPKGGNLTLEVFIVDSLSKLSRMILWPKSNLGESMERKGCPYVCISIEDEGTGISYPDIPMVSEPFHSSTFEGRGLGLYISTKIMEKHGGFIGIEPCFGKGTKFYILLPYR